ncbi:MAG: hypothetical protein ACYDEA_08710 [Candidatus Dormibacteria bacterium]
MGGEGATSSTPSLPEVAGRSALEQDREAVAGDLRGIEQRTRKEDRVGRPTRQHLSQWSRGTQERHLAEKTRLETEHLGEPGSTRTCPACLARNRKGVGTASARGAVSSAVGAINIHQEAEHGACAQMGVGTKIRVTHLRAA